MKNVLEWNVPADGEQHLIGGGPIVLVDITGFPGVVQVWTEEPHISPSHLATNRRVRVFRTGEPILDDWAHVGSVQSTGLVWHVYQDPSL